jgi:hypothetical protein
MANNVAVTPGSGATVATDDVGGVHYQVVKLATGTEDSAVRIGQLEDAAHASGDAGIMALAVRNDNFSTTFGADGDYSPIGVDNAGRIGINLLTPGVGAGHLGKAEDAVHSNADTGVMALAVRRDTAASSSATDGDYVTVNTDATGRLWTHAGAIDAGETHIGEVGGNTAIIRLNPTITAGAYSANDVVGGEITLTGAMRTSGGSGILQSLTVHDADSESAALEFYFFDSAPGAAIADNGAFSWNATDEDKYLGMVSVLTGDYITRGGDVFATIRNIGLPVVATGSADLFLYIVLTGAPTFTATSDLTFTFGFLRD